MDRAGQNSQTPSRVEVEGEGSEDVSSDDLVGRLVGGRDQQVQDQKLGTNKL